MSEPYDILLMRAPQELPPKYNAVLESLGIGQLLAILKKEGFRVKLFDCLLRGCSVDNAVEQILRERFAVLGVSIGNEAPSKKLLNILRVLRERGCKEHITFGGHFPSLAYEKILRHISEVDSVFRGEADRSLPAFLRRIRSGGNWRDSKGIAYRKGERIIVNPLFPLVKDLDVLPRVDREQLPVYLKKKAIPSVYSSRGCYGSCSFCSIYCFYRRNDRPTWRRRSATSVVDEVEWLAANYGIKEVMFCDDNFFGPGHQGREFARQVADEMLRRKLGVYFAIACRANDMHEPTFRHLKEAGLRHIFIGIESFSDKTLRLYAKGAAAQRNVEALKIANKLRLNTQIGFIMFHPYVTLDEVKLNIQYLAKTRNLNVSNIYSWLDVYHGTAIERDLESKGLLVRKGWSNSFLFVNKNAELFFRLMKKIFMLYHPVAYALAGLEDPITYEWRRPYKSNMRSSDRKVLHDFERLNEIVWMRLINAIIEELRLRTATRDPQLRRLYKEYEKDVKKTGKQLQGQAHAFIENFLKKVDYYRYDEVW